jgi:cell division protein FtsB
MEQETYTIREAAERCDFSYEALRRRVDRGSLRAIVDNGVRRLARSELERAGLWPGSSPEARQLEELRRAVQGLRDENERLRAENGAIKAEIARPEAQDDGLKAAYEALSAEVDALREENERLHDEIDRLSAAPEAAPAPEEPAYEPEPEPVELAPDPTSSRLARVVAGSQDRQLGLKITGLELYEQGTLVRWNLWLEETDRGASADDVTDAVLHGELPELRLLDDSGRTFDLAHGSTVSANLEKRVAHGVNAFAPGVRDGASSITVLAGRRPFRFSL